MFQDAIQTALQMKRDEIENGRRIYNGYPLWLQFSIRPDPAVQKCRLETAPTATRLTLATSFYAKGIKKSTKAKYMEALEDFYNAMSLFKWVYSVNTDKRQVLQDTDIRHGSIFGDTEAEITSIKELRSSCLLAMIPCYHKTHDWKAMYTTASELIDLCPSNTLAYQYRYQAITSDPRKVTADHHNALKELKNAVKQNPNDLALRNYYALQLKEVSVSLEKEKRTVAKMFSPTPPVVGASSSGSGGQVKLSFQDALKKSNEIKAAADYLEQRGQAEDARTLRDKHSTISHSLRQHMINVASEMESAASEPHDERSKKVLAILFKNMEERGGLLSERDKEALVAEAIDEVRKEEAEAAALKWVQHVDTATIVSMLRTRNFQFAGEGGGGLASHSREDLISALSECMATDIVDLIREESEEGNSHDLDLFTRLMERYDDGSNGALTLEGKVPVRNRVSDWVRTIIAIIIAIYVIVIIYYGYTYTDTKSGHHRGPAAARGPPGGV